MCCPLGVAHHKCLIRDCPVSWYIFVTLLESSHAFNMFQHEYGTPLRYEGIMWSFFINLSCRVHRDCKHMKNFKLGLIMKLIPLGMFWVTRFLAWEDMWNIKCLQREVKAFYTTHVVPFSGHRDSGLHSPLKGTKIVVYMHTVPFRGYRDSGLHAHCPL